MKDISILIPAYNEEKHVYRTVQALASQGLAAEILVVDDGSTDRTAYWAGRAGARVFRLPKNMGKGEAVNYGLTKVQGEIVLLLDADLQDSAPAALKLLDAVRAGEADLAIARFPAGKSGGGFGLARRTAVWGIRRLTGAEIDAPLSGQRCAYRRVFQDLQPLAPGFGMEVGMTIDALRKGYRSAWWISLWNTARRDAAGRVTGTGAGSCWIYSVPWRPGQGGERELAGEILLQVSAGWLPPLPLPGFFFPLY